MNNTGIVKWSDREKELSFQHNDIFDRVINLKILANRGDNGSVITDKFVIRSDYEKVSPTVFGDKGYIRKCRYKPSIKVQYKQVSSASAISIDIYISNFFILDTDGNTIKQFNANAYPLISVEVQMGYFGQFSAPYRESLNKVPTFKQFDEMKAPSGVQVIFCQVEYVQTDKLPPDYQMHIHGYVGSCYNAPVSESEGNNTISVQQDANEDYKIIFNEADFSNNRTFRTLGQYVFNNITCRFIKNKAMLDISKDNKDIGEVKSLLKALKKDKNGCMDDKPAYDYGVKIFISEGIAKTKFFYGSYHTDKDGEKVDTSFFTGLSGSTPAMCLNTLKDKVNPDWRVQGLLNGDFLLYTVSELEDIEGLSKANWYTYNPNLVVKNITKDDVKKDGFSIDVKDLNKYGMESFEYEKILEYVENPKIGAVDIRSLPALSKGTYVDRKELPCVKSISSDKLTTVVCPFFFYVQPFQAFYFYSRYALGGQVAYFTKDPTKNDTFRALWQDVSFATNEDINECSIVSKGD